METKYSEGHVFLCGIDESGIGSGVAEVFVAACILDPARPIKGLADSKSLSRKKREELNLRIRENALDFCVTTASLREIEQLNVLYASHVAMKRALLALRIPPDVVLVDGNKLPDGIGPSLAVVKGDVIVPAISAASILAKVARDEAMLRYHEQYPEYGFDLHKGYFTPPHISALEKYGPSPIHRRGYRPIKELLSRV